VAAALAVGLGAPVTITQASAGHAPAPSIMVRGMTVTAAGRAQPGTKVTFRAWPDQAVMQSLKLGQKVPWVLVGSTVSGPDGKFAFSAPVAALKAESTDGVTNVEADTATGMEMFPVVVSRNGGNSYLPPAPQLRIDSPPPPGTHGCNYGYWSYVASLGKHWAVVGQTYIAAKSGASQHFTYQNGQSTTFSFGVSANGKGGTFSIKGTYNWSAENVVPWRWHGAHQSHWYITEFHWAKYECHETYHGIQTHSYGQAPNGYFGGALLRIPKPYVPRTPRRYCAPYAGASPSFTTSQAVTWTAGLSVAAVLDDAGAKFEADVTTGYDDMAAVTYKIGDRIRLICGTNGGPGSDPKQLVVR